MDLLLLFLLSLLPYSWVWRHVRHLREQNAYLRQELFVCRDQLAMAPKEHKEAVK